MVRAGLMPSAAAAACRLVVLNGTGGRWVRLLRSTPLTVASLASATLAQAASAASFFQKRPSAWPILKGSEPACAASPEITQ